MSDVASDIWDGIEATYDADTVAGGLKNTASAAYVPTFLREDDAQNRNRQWPRILVRIACAPEEAFDGITHVPFVVTFELFTHYPRGHTDQNAVLDRLRTKYHRTFSIADTGSWTFTNMLFQRIVQANLVGGDGVPNELKVVVPMRGYAREV